LGSGIRRLSCTRVAQSCALGGRCFAFAALAGLVAVGLIAFAPTAHAGGPVPPDFPVGPTDCLDSAITAGNSTGTNTASFGGNSYNACGVTMNTAVLSSTPSWTCPYLPRSGSGMGTATADLPTPWGPGVTRFWTGSITARCYGCVNGRASDFPPFDVTVVISASGYDSTGTLYTEGGSAQNRQRTFHMTNSPAYGGPC